MEGDNQEKAEKINMTWDREAVGCYYGHDCFESYAEANEGDSFADEMVLLERVTNDYLE